jgi:VWFA-related protein
MRKRFTILLSAATLVSWGHAQTPASSTSATLAAGPGALVQAPVLHSNSELVVLDVVVQDQAGHPVRGLKPEDFHLTEAGVPQTLSHVEEHPSQTATPAVRVPPLPPGTFTDYTPVPADSAMNVLLVDALNTPMTDQAFVRNRLKQYVAHAEPNTRIAIFGLANRLILLQSFTSDPSVLRDVIDRKLIPRNSPLMQDQANGPPQVNELSGAAAASYGVSPALASAANLREFEAELGEMETQFRVQYTLDAFNTLAHYLAGFPGRKNLIWFSGSFPLVVMPDPSKPHPLESESIDEDEFHETVDLLAKARVAVYPIDARGAMVTPGFESVDPDTPTKGQVREFNHNLVRWTETQAVEHATMNDLAAGTGGQAFYNTNDLAGAVHSAMVAGSDYYTLSYTPSTPKQDGSYRPLRVSLRGDAPQNLQLSYRRGYYTNKPSRTETTVVLNPNQPTPDEARAAAYKQAAMSRGAPTPQDLVFKVRVLPASTTTETAPARDNQTAPSVASNGPFRRYDLDFLALPSELTFTQQPDGHSAAQVEFLAYVYDTEGRLLDATGRDISVTPNSSDLVKLARSILRCHLELSVPDRAETFLRIGIRDVTTNKFGVIEIPASSVSSLAPATNEPAATSGRPTPPRD